MTTKELLKRLDPRNRKSRGMPREGLYIDQPRAWLAELTGMERSKISKILTGRRKCSLREGLILAAVLGTSAHQLAADLESMQEFYRRWKRRSPAVSQSANAVEFPQ